MVELIDNFGILLPTGGVLVYADGGNPRVELNWQMAETAERPGLRLGLDRRQHHLQAAYGTFNHYGGAGLSNPPGHNWDGG